MPKPKRTSKPIAKIASKELKSTKKDKSVDASALVQVQPKKETSKKVATKSSKELKNPTTPKKEQITLLASTNQSSAENEVHK